MSMLKPDGQTVAGGPREVKLYSLVLDSEGRVWERNGAPYKPMYEWWLAGGNTSGLRHGHYKVDQVAFPVTILAQYD